MDLRNLISVEDLWYMNRVPKVIRVPGLISELGTTSTTTTTTTTTTNSDEIENNNNNRVSRKRIIIVSNQLPIRGTRVEGTGQWCFEYDFNGGLALELRDVLSADVEVVYVGCLKVEIDEDVQDDVAAQLLEKFRCVPVFLPNEIRDKYYHGFCKHYLWPLFHYMLPMMSVQGPRFDREQWTAYTISNKLFANRVTEIFNPEDDYVWINDYHLMLLPTLLRRRFYRVKLGFFLHSPFPSSEIYRTLPSKRGYIGLDYHGRTITVKILPVGVHMGHLQRDLSHDETAKMVKELKERYNGKIVMLGLDDMDMFKGISFKIKAMKQLLCGQNVLKGKAVLIQILNPARSRGQDIQDVESEIADLAKETNEMFGEPGYEPVVIINGPLSSQEKAAYYAIADCCVVTPVRDGMNLVPYKYTVCRQGSPVLDEALGIDKAAQPKKSMIVVSEFIGCSPSLSGAIRVNPWNIDDLSSGMYHGITAKDAEKELRHEKHYKYISTHDVSYWAKSFDHDLVRACKLHDDMRFWSMGMGLRFRVVALSKNFKKLSMDHAVWTYSGMNNRLILLDYDGTVIPENSADKTPSSKVISVLNSLCSDPKNIVFIVSGRGRDNLSQWFSPCEKLGISAEHGYFTRWTKDSSWETCTLTMSFDWKNMVLPVMEHYTEETDGSFIEQKESALVWHHEHADVLFGSFQAKDLLHHLENVLSNEPVVVKRGRGIVEVKPQGISKGTAVENIISTMISQGKEPDFVLCIGDDYSDEVMFETIAAKVPNQLPAAAKVFPCSVGMKPSKAKYFLDDTDEVMKLLQGLANPGRLQQLSSTGEFQSFRAVAGCQALPLVKGIWHKTRRRGDTQL
nr:putative alpha,alpha-trehalose-phosphate synthase [udp-forming] 11 [Quercus suber]